MYRLYRGVESLPVFVPRVHRVAAIARYRGHPVALLQSFREFPVLFVSHLEAVCFGITARFMHVWRVAVEEGFAFIVQSNNINRRPIFNLDPE